MNEKIIYSKWLAYELRKLGFKIIRTDVNPNFPQYDVYVFENTSRLLQEMSRLTQERR